MGTEDASKFDVEAPLPAKFRDAFQSDVYYSFTIVRLSGGRSDNDTPLQVDCLAPSPGPSPRAGQQVFEWSMQTVKREANQLAQLEREHAELKQEEEQVVSNIERLRDLALLHNIFGRWCNSLGIIGTNTDRLKAA